MWVIQQQCHRGRVSSICSGSSAAPTDSVSVSPEPLVPIELLLLGCDKVSSCMLSLNPSATSDIVGRSFPACSVQRRANSATVHRELTSQFSFILGSVTFSISPSESVPRTQCARLVLSVLFTVMIAGRPVMSTRRTTPKLKTSLFSLK